MIEAYQFGRMVIGGTAYTSDLILLTDKILSSWWRKSGHKLCLSDLEEVVKEKPDILIIGTGAIGMMKVNEEVKQYAQKEGISLIIERTGKAVQTYNHLSGGNKITAAFHLTC
jgi:hypothetical protein